VNAAADLERDLEQLPAESIQVSANGLRHHVLDYGGEGPPVLVLPGITSPAISWDFVCRRLSDAARLLVLDVRGRGLSDQPPSGYSLNDYAADAVDVIEALGLERPILLGHSMGARIAVAASVRRPHVARATIAVDPPIGGPYPTPLQAFLTQLEEAHAGTTVEEVRGHWPGWPEHELALRARWLPTCSEAAIVETHHGFETDDFLFLWHEAQPPLALVYGGNSPVVPEDGAQRLRRTNPHAELVRVDGAGHMIPWDQLDAFLAAVRPLIEEFGGRNS
jgi:N-formylmaleamate deformylase